MSDYIKREDAISTMYEFLKQANDISGRNNEKLAEVLVIAKNVIYTIPLADVAPVRHGYWIHVDDVYGISGMYKGEVRECSECGYRFERLKDSGISMKVCPNCGARMDGEDDE